MNGKHYIGKRISSLELYDELGPVTGVALIVDSENEIFSGNETGYVLEMECPYATQDMADNILASVLGSTYKGFRAQNAQLGLDSELGDGVTVDDTYTMLAYQMVSFGAGHVSEIAAPGENVVDHEYPYLSPVQKEVRRNRAQAYSLITKTAEEIRTEVHSALYVEDGTDEDGNPVYTEKYSTTEQTAEKISAAVNTSKEYTNEQLGDLEKAVDEDLSDLEEALGKDLSDFEGTVNAKFESYSTTAQTDEMISTAVHSALYVTNGTDEDGNTLYVEKYSTTEQTDEKISAGVNSAKSYSDGQLTTKLTSYSTTEQTSERISSSIHEALYTEAETDVLPWTVYEFTAGGSQVSSISFVLEEGVHYYVNWGDTEYDCGTPTVSTSSTLTSLALATDAFSIIYLYNNSTMEAITSRITPYADASSVRIFTRSDTVEMEKYSSVTQTASRISAAVYGLVDEDACQSMIDVSLGKIELVVTNSDDGTSCSIVMKTTTGDGDASSEIQISSANIALDGFVTFTGLSDGTTEIDGGCIKTGTIDAERINLTGAISFSDLSDYSNVNSRITGAQSDADDAWKAATQIANGTYTSGTFINGTDIYSPNLYGDTISLLDGDSNLVGTMSMVLSNTYAFDITSEMSIRFTAASGYNAHMGVDGGPSFTARGDIGCACIAGKMVVTSGSYGALSDRPEGVRAGQVYFAIS